MWDDECWDAEPSSTTGAGTGTGTTTSYEAARVQPSVEYDSRESHRSGSDSHRRAKVDRMESGSDGGRVCFEVPGPVISRIIGRGGSNVREIRNRTKARIDIDNNRSDGAMGTVTISGAPESVEKARSAIEDIVNSANEFSRPARGDNYGNGPYRGRQDRWGDDRSNRSDGASRGRSDFSRNSYRGNDHRRGGYGDSYGHRSAGSDAYAADDEIIDWSALNKKADEAAKERWAKCPPLVKTFYREREEVARMAPAEVDAFRLENNNIVVDRTFKDGAGDRKPIPNPVFDFHQAFGDFPDLMDELRKQNFTKPTPIQAQAWPVLLNGEDMIGIAQTGTGKTLAFLLPALVHIEGQPIPRSDRGGPNVLVLAPTRELALQIEKEVAKYQFRDIKAVCLYGGGDRRAQINTVRRGVEILIATPGRLNDLVEEGVVDVTSITYLVLDEADRMLDMGFEPQIRKVLLDVRPDRQTVMTSATWPDGVRRLAQSYMVDPIQVYIGTLDLAATHTVTQLIEVMEEDDKYFRICEFVRDMLPTDKVIIFCGKKVRADDLSSEFVLSGIACQSIHGNREQSDREQALEDIKRGAVNILIATDVASRGIDIDDITHVVNYDFPRNIEEYVHRVGRTGRAGRTGISLSFLTRSDWTVAAELIKIMEEANQDVPDELHDMARRFAARRERDGDRGGRGRFRGSNRRW